MRITDLDENIIDELKIEKPGASDTLGIPRKKMPQIKEHDYPEFLKYLEENGVTISRGRVPASQLKPIQKKFSDKGVMKALLKRKNEKPVIASSDDYIIDGHHRWLAAANTRNSVSIMRADVPVKELLELVHAFPKTYYKDIYESASAGATSAGAVASVANPPSRKKKRNKYGAPEAPQLKNPDGTVKNALDVDSNVLGSKTVKR